MKKVEEDNGLVVLEYLIGQQDIIEYNDLINIINGLNLESKYLVVSMMP